MVLSCLPLILLAYVLAPKINDLLGLWNPKRGMIIELNATQADREGNVEARKSPFLAHRAHPDLIEQVEFNGLKRTFNVADMRLWFVTHFDPEEMEAQAAAISDVPEEVLMAHQMALEEQRARNNVLVRGARAVVRQADKIIDQTAEQHHYSLEQKEQGMKHYDRKSAVEAVKEEIPEFEKAMEGDFVKDEFKDKLEQESKEEQENTKQNGGEE